ncbi:MAG: phosphoenolpyruvate carboxykinase (GTP), partial [Actinobacteria bacterium]|nr:phosphoenolpyruvate carboxykinase (GTP) [Actinomycetota bacterium]
ASEQTAAAEGTVGELRRDPFAMLPFCGYNMADYWSHWLSFAEKGLSLPKIFRVNWFLKNSSGKFVWPGFSENARVLRWIVGRVEGNLELRRTPLGGLPNLGDLGIAELDLSEEDESYLLHWSKTDAAKELAEVEAYLEKFEHHLPQVLRLELEQRRGFVV